VENSPFFLIILSLPGQSGGNHGKGNNCWLFPGVVDLAGGTAFR
jgi:hypothetical protein